MTDLDLAQRLAEAEAENDQWQKKLAETWAELEQLRAHDKEATALTIDQQVEIGRLSVEVDRLRAALKGVLAEADRKTDAFDRAHAALERD